MLGGLWPLWNGRLHAPKEKDLFYIPQKPYLCVDTLRDQLIYPDNYNESIRKGWNDDKLETLLHQVKLTYLLGKQLRWMV